MSESSLADEAQIRLRLVFPSGAMIGPGKVDLLEHIAAEGSIAAAGRRMNMSYKRAWSLVEEMNAAFQNPVVDRTRGGAKGGGAQLTDTGRAIITRYRALQDRVAREGAAEISDLADLLRDMSE